MSKQNNTTFGNKDFSQLSKSQSQQKPTYQRELFPALHLPNKEPKTQQSYNLQQTQNYGQLNNQPQNIATNQIKTPPTKTLVHLNFVLFTFNAGTKLNVLPLHID